MMNLVFREIVARASVEAKQKTDCPLVCPRDDLLKFNKRVFNAAYLRSNSNVEEMASGSGVNGFYRPRSALARALYEKQHNDRYLQELDQNECETEPRNQEYEKPGDHTPSLHIYLRTKIFRAQKKKKQISERDLLLLKWYQVNKSRLSTDLQLKFVQLHPDDETKEFLTSSIEKSSWVWTQCWYLVAKAVLKHFWSVTDINGWLGRGSMFVLSEEQARAILRPARHPPSQGAIVDVGAGDGEVSRRFAHLYTQKFATEISASMRKALSTKGYTILGTENWWNYRQYDCVCMLNLLDRCSKPQTMLKQARETLTPDGVLMLALVLPYKPYVEVTTDHKPSERLPIEGANFEDQLASFVTFMRKEVGFELVSWTRAPYLCEGDFAQAYYWLDDSVYVFKPIASTK